MAVGVPPGTALPEQTGILVLGHGRGSAIPSLMASKHFDTHRGHLRPLHQKEHCMDSMAFQEQMYGTQARRYCMRQNKTFRSM